VLNIDSARIIPNQHPIVPQVLSKDNLRTFGRHATSEICRRLRKRPLGGEKVSKRRRLHAAGTRRAPSKTFTSSHWSLEWSR
jgi:hypothetical protein